MSRLPLRPLLIASLFSSILLPVQLQAQQPASRDVPSVAISPSTIPAGQLGSAARAPVIVIQVRDPDYVEPEAAAVEQTEPASAATPVAESPSPVAEAPAADPVEATVAVEEDEPLPPPSRDGWVARFFWSPDFCSRRKGSTEPQCQPPAQGFVLRDLIRVIDGKEIDDCKPGQTQMSPRMLEQLSRLTKNRREARATWRLYGRCSGMSEVDYVSWAEFVDRRIAWPEWLTPGGPDKRVNAEQLVQDLATDNSGLDAEEIVLQCDHKRLESVYVCMDGAFNFNAASCPPIKACKGRIRLSGSRYH